MLRTWRIAAWLVAFLVVLGLPGPARGDGCAFFHAKPPAEMPGQMALIAHENGLQTLAIETRLVGEGEDCAWIVPLPAHPEVSPASSGVFPSLRAMCQPAIERYPSFTAPLVVLVIIGLVLLLSGGWRGIVVAVLLTVLGFITLMPALGTARSSAGPVAGVSVIDRRVVGAFEVITLDATRGESLSDWLSGNGFTVPESAGPVIEHYIKEGWCFVASRLRHEPGKETTPHPLVFRFVAKEPVYPMRLTGLQSGTLDLELYVFGPGTAKVDGMKVETTGPVKRGEYIGVGRRPHAGRDGIVLSHAGIEALAGSAAHLTKLVGTFTPAQMAEDLVIGFGPGEIAGRTALSRGNAITRAVDAGLSVLAGGLIAGAIAMAVWRRGPEADLKRRAAWVLVSMVALGGVAGLATAATGPRTVEVQRWGGYRVEWHGVMSTLWERAEDATRAGELITADWVRAEVKRILERGELIYRGDTKAVRIPIEEDSPGNYTLREVPGGVAIVPVNELGQEMNKEGDGFLCVELVPAPPR